MWGAARAVLQRTHGCVTSAGRRAAGNVVLKRAAAAVAAGDSSNPQQQQLLLSDAEVLLLQCLDASCAALGPEHPNSLACVRALVRVYVARPEVQGQIVTFAKVLHDANAGGCG